VRTITELASAAQLVHKGSIQTLNYERKVSIMLNVIRQFVKEEEGASAAEYAILLSLIALGMVAGTTALGGAIGNALNAAAGIVGS
jgi:pilus assembly protein Flp/PilA